MMKKSFLCSLLLIFGFPTLAHGRDVFLWNLVSRQPYKTVWRQAVSNAVRNTDDNWWLKDARGTGTPVQQVVVNHTLYYQASLCEPHNCGDNFILVLINKQRVAAIQFKADGANRAYGNPNRHELQYLLRQYEREASQ
ncbi:MULTISPECIES: Ivy family c-type lysozyme inhibitor [Eikenella]|uniref:Ivy family c-type lysozyme inhibitor n=1 Tax=Eikenella TaxID=538 RepID=UPI0009EDFD02|nr:MULTISPECIES: Ivy family c-type lysozyme inhibitor [Eikenella]